jgi:hypothetical protein
MPSDRLRVLVLALVSLGAIVLSAWVLDWFQHGPTSFDLDDAAHVAGAWGKLATLTLGSTGAFALVVVVQVGGRLFAGGASERLTRLGYVLAMLGFATAVATAFFLQPDVMWDFDDDYDRTWAPIVMLGGILAGVLALYFAALDDAHAMMAMPIVRVDPAVVVARTKTPTGAMPALARTTTPVPVIARTRTPTAAPAIARTTTPTRVRASTQAPPENLRGKLAFAVATGELTRGGIDARREDGSTVLVMWRDVVGVVARRLPVALDGAIFIDVVSQTGSTLRLLPWSRLTGEVPDTLDRERALVREIADYCPTIQIDPATRSFIDGTDAAQLRDEDTLAAHDTRLA